jgi:hypothetical protein
MHETLHARVQCQGRWFGKSFPCNRPLVKVCDAAKTPRPEPTSFRRDRAVVRFRHGARQVWAAIRRRQGALPCSCACAMPYVGNAAIPGRVRGEIFRRNLKREVELGVISAKAMLRMEGGLIEIILTVCAIANPAHCEEKYLQFAFDGSLDQCMMAAQPYIAQWIGQHPGWIATRWSCGYPGSQKRQI